MNKYIRKSGHCKWCHWLVEDMGHHKDCPVSEVMQLSDELERLKKDCAPFEAQIAQAKIYTITKPIVGVEGSE